MIFRKWANSIEFTFLLCLCGKYIKFSFENLGNVREDKNTRRWTTFGFENEKKFNFSEIYRTFNFIIKTKSSPSTRVFIFSNTSEIFTTKFYIFLTQTHVETGLNRSHELSIFLKYHMPLMIKIYYLPERKRPIWFNLYLKALEDRLTKIKR